MSRPTWAVELAAADGEAAQALRLVAGVEARFSEDGSSLWLRGAEVDDDTTHLVRRLPCRTRMILLPDGHGIEQGKSVPSISLTGAGWVPLRHLFTLEMPSAREAGLASANAPWELVAADEEAPSDILGVAFNAWLKYAITAPAIRLAGLRFAVSEEGNAIIHGTPLPPLLGKFYQSQCGIATPAGFALHPAVNPELLARHFRLNEGDLLLFQADHPSELIAATDFAQASRSAVRETAAALAQLER
ncbi:MAG: hypothetical protein ACI9R3_004007 [Verrucomicrobiales bacterium]|jgi:hypothetical protein